MMALVCLVVALAVFVILLEIDVRRVNAKLKEEREKQLVIDILTREQEEKAQGFRLSPGVYITEIDRTSRIYK